MSESALREVVEGLRFAGAPLPDFNDGYNQALDDVLALLDQGSEPEGERRQPRISERGETELEAALRDVYLDWFNAADAAGIDRAMRLIRALGFVAEGSPPPASPREGWFFDDGSSIVLNMLAGGGAEGADEVAPLPTFVGIIHTSPEGVETIGHYDLRRDRAAEGGDTLTPETPLETAQIVEYLRRMQGWWVTELESFGGGEASSTAKVCGQAADRLEAQAAAIARYETALRGIAEGHAHPPEKAARRALVGEEAP